MLKGLKVEFDKTKLRWIGLVPVGIFLLIIVMSCFYTVDQTEYAVLVTLGKPNPAILEPGLKFKLPFVQSVKKVSRETFSLTFGYSEATPEISKRRSKTADPDEIEVYMNDAKMITGDENIILVDFEVQWRVTDPIKFFYNNEDPVLTLRNVVSAALRGVIGSTKVDEALTDGRAQIMNDVRSVLTRLVDNYDVGIGIVNVNLQDVDLPTEQVSAAFKKVTSAREDKITKVNEATRYENERVNSAQGQKEALISNAERTKTERIERAKGDVATFNAIYSEYIKNKEVTRQRLVIETLNKILPKAKIYIMDESSGTVKYLPIDVIKDAKGGVSND